MDAGGDLSLRTGASRTSGTVREDRKEKIGSCAKYEFLEMFAEMGHRVLPV